MSDTLLVESPVDGNAVLGALSLALGRPMDGASVTCSGCGDTHAVARTVVYRRAPGIVVRCPGCTGVEVVIVSVRRRLQVTMPGISALLFGERTAP